MSISRRTRLLAPLAAVLLVNAAAAQPAFRTSPAIALEAEDFHVQSGWKVVRCGPGNSAGDGVPGHVSGERLLGTDARDDTASAFADITVPESGGYRLWVRYRYPPFSEARFRVVVRQNDRTVLDHTVGKKDSPRYAGGELYPRAQHDPAISPDDLADEVVTVPNLAAGKARICLRAAAQPQAPGVAAPRRIDLVYLTRDTADAWLKHYRQENRTCPLLDAFRDTRAARYEVRFTNRGDRPADFHVTHVYNRPPWGLSEADLVRGVKPGAAGDWVGLRAQDTAHFGLVRFSSSGQPFDLEVRPAGGAVERKLSGASPLLLYLPPYPGKGEKAVTPVEELDAVLAGLGRAPAVGREPTRPLCYGGWMPLGQDNEYGRKYAQLYAALGLRSLHPALTGPAVEKNLRAAGVLLTPTWAATAYRNLPTADTITRARVELAHNGLRKQLRWFDYGDDVSFSEWVDLLVQCEVERSKAEGRPLSSGQVLSRLWVEWLGVYRPDATGKDYWLPGWGPYSPARLRPDTSAEAAAARPRLYVDSLLFYEQTATRFAAEGAELVREGLGDDVLCGGGLSCQPLGYPTTARYVRWFRGRAADAARPTDTLWQWAGVGPMAGGYVSEHFRAGLRDNSRGVIRPHVLPNSPGGSEGDFLRSAFTQLAHGATALDFHGVGMNETFAENYIDHRDHARYRAVRDVTGAVGLVEDLLPDSRPVPSPVALLVSESTERWDLAGIAAAAAGHDPAAPGFRKTRLHYHLDRLGLWTALTFLGVSPDLLLEEDVNAGGLKGYKVLVVVGDCLPPELAVALEEWVRGGGVLLATAGAGRFDAYRRPGDKLSSLFGLKDRQTEERTTFIRPRQELPLLEVVGAVKGDGWKMPQLAVFERVEPAEDARVLGRFEGGGAAVVERRLGKGRVYYVAALPGVAYLRSALNPPQGVEKLLQSVLDAAAVQPAVEVEPARIDSRLLKAPKGYILPLANYHDRVGQKVTLTIRPEVPVGKVTSAYHGVLALKRTKGGVVVTIPALGHGDVLRIDP